MSAFPALSLPGGCGCCDCVIRTADGGEFRAHRAFLCATSPFFRAAFCTEYGSRRDLLLEDVPAEALGVLLSFYYLDEPGITSDNVAEVLEAADMLLMDEVRDLCLDHLLRNMDTDNCLGLAALAQRYHCPRFKDAIFCFVRENFDAVWRSSDEFPETAASLLAELFASDELNVRDEVDLLHATERWSLGGVATSPEGQDADLSRLLNCVRVGLCSQSALENFRELRSSLALSGAYHVAVCEAVQKGPCLCSPSPLLLMQLATLTPDAYHSLPCPHTSGSDTSLNDVTMAEETTSATEAVAQPHCKHCGGSSPERWLPRMPYEMLFVVGGWSAGEEREAVETYDPRAKRWLMQPVEGLLPRQVAPGLQNEQAPSKAEPT
ncbi:kelch-like protein 10 [Amblyomma americanum]